MVRVGSLLIISYVRLVEVPAVTVPAKFTPPTGSPSIRVESAGQEVLIASAGSVSAAGSTVSVMQLCSVGAVAGVLPSLRLA